MFILVGGPVFSRWFQMLIFGHWLDCVLEGFNLPKNDVAIFFGDFFLLFSQFQITAQIVLNNFIILPKIHSVCKANTQYIAKSNIIIKKKHSFQQLKLFFGF